MSDLQCAVRVFLAPGGLSAPSLTGLAAERIVSVLAAPSEPYARSATEAATALRCPVQLREGLEEVEHLEVTVQALADTHRGEAVLLVVDPPLVPQVLGRLDAVGDAGGGAGLLLLEGDADGWGVQRWPGEAVG